MEGESWSAGDANSSTPYVWETILGEVASKFGVDDIILEIMIGSDEKNVNKSVVIVSKLSKGALSRVKQECGSCRLTSRTSG